MRRVHYLATGLVYTNDEQWYGVHPLLVKEYAGLVARRAARLRVTEHDVDAIAASILAEARA